MLKEEKEKLYKKELQKLNRYFKNMPKEQQQLVEGLKQQAAFLYATLMELQERINEEGPVEWFVQGKQRLLREHPASKIYNEMVKSYAAIIKQLLTMLPKEEVKATEDELLAFIKKAK